MVRTTGGVHVLQDSPIVCFESAAPDDSQGSLHSALMINSFKGVFPQNTLFELKEVKEAPFAAIVQGGRSLMVHQRCLVVSATFQTPTVTTTSPPSSKMSAPVTTLQYGNRDAYINGLSDITQKPPLRMEDEFDRHKEWTDWKGVKYSLRDCW